MVKININFTPPTNAYIVGGTVRDILLENPPKDIDIITTKDPLKLAAQVAEKTRGKLIELGKPGIKLFRVIAADQIYDIAPANGDRIEEDLAKRDYTINAMAIPLANPFDKKNIIDPFGGINDLKNGIIRMVAAENLDADPIRLLRAYRIASLQNFSIHPETSRVIRRLSRRIYDSAGERVGDELMQLFNTPGSRKYIAMMDESGLLAAIFPELIPLKGCTQNIHHQYDAFEHTLTAFGFLEKFLHTPDAFTRQIKNLKDLLPARGCFALLKYTILIHDIGKPVSRSIDANGHIHFYAHEKKSADLAAAINRRLRLSNAQQHYVDFIIRNHLKALTLFNAWKNGRLTQKAITRFFLRCDPMTREILLHTTADLHGKGKSENTRQFIRFLNHMVEIYANSFLPKKLSASLITGHDLIREFGLTPSPLFSKILAHIKEEYFSGNIASRKEALSQVKKFLDIP